MTGGYSVEKSGTRPRFGAPVRRYEVEAPQRTIRRSAGLDIHADVAQIA
jgi:hypothetical protein